MEEKDHEIRHGKKRLRLIARDYDARPRQFELPDPSPRCDLLYNRRCKMRRAKAWSESLGESRIETKDRALCVD